MSNSPASKSGNLLVPSKYCSSCGAGLSASARFCHRCGASVSGGGSAAQKSAEPSAASTLSSVMPWGVAFVALLALVAMVAGRNFGAAKGSTVDGSFNAIRNPAIDGPAMGIAPGSGPAIDISAMSDEERADRLYERVMVYEERGLRDSVLMFAPMGLSAHEMIEGIDLDRRYHSGRIAEAAGMPELAMAQSDTILATDPNHLLGIILGSRVARVLKDTGRVQVLDQQLLRVIDQERARSLPEYDQHRAEIEIALALARSQE